MALASVRHIDSDGNTAISAENWPDAFAGATQKPKKFAIENNGTRILGPSSNLFVAITQVGNNDGSTELRIGTDTVTLSPPYGLAGAVTAPGSGGVFGSTGTYGYKVSALNANGETIGGFEATAVIDATTEKVNLTWTTITGATGYKVFRTPTPGTYGATTLRATLGAVNSYSDDGSATATGTPATVNTSGGWLLTAALGAAGGAWGSTGVRYWRLVAYDSQGTVIADSLEASFNVTDTSKKVLLTWAAVSGVDHYILYRSTASGVYSSPAIVVTLSPSTSYSDTGSAVSSGALTDDISYGIPPTLGTDPLAAGSLGIGQQFFYWVNRVIPLSTSEDGNPRTAVVLAEEV